MPGESRGQRSPAGYSPWGHKESDMTEVTSIQAHTQEAFIIIELESKNLQSWNITGPRLQTAPS